jgi:hypothetical protein
MVSIYAVSYMLNRPFKSGSRRVDAAFLMIGGYVSGASLIAAPLVVPVAASRVPREQLRDTLFVLWFVLVALKLMAFVITGVDLQWIQHLWLLPCAGDRPRAGFAFSSLLAECRHGRFFRSRCIALLLVSAGGSVRADERCLPELMPQG